MNMTEKLAQYALSISEDSIKPGVKELAKEFFTDCIGCLIAGTKSDAVQIAKHYITTCGGQPTSTILCSGGLKTDVCNAAMVNGIAAHVLDYDDVSNVSYGHPSVVMVPTALSVGEMVNASGKDILMAYITGIEVSAMVGRAVQPDNYKRNWHSTSTLGIFGATAIAGRLLQLNEKELTHAFAIAASESSGIKGNFGTMTKSLHAGRAASKGIFSAQMAKLGYGSNPDIFQTAGGWGEVTTGKFDEENMQKYMDNNESEFLNPGITMKPWSSCRLTHNSVDAMLKLMNDYNFDSKNITHVLCKVLPGAKDALKYPHPVNTFEGKFSMQYCIALAILNKKLTMKDFNGDPITDPRIINLMDKVEMVVDNTLANGVYINERCESEVVVTTTDDKEYIKRVDYGLGDPQNRMSDDDRILKFNDCLELVLNISKTEELKYNLKNIEDLASIKTLISSIDEAIL